MNQKHLNQNNLKQQPFKPNRLRIFLAHTKLVEEGSQTVKPFFLGLILPRGELLAIVQTFQERVFFKEN